MRRTEKPTKRSARSRVSRASKARYRVRNCSLAMREKPGVQPAASALRPVRMGNSGCRPSLPPECIEVNVHLLAAVVGYLCQIGLLTQERKHEVDLLGSEGEPGRKLQGASSHRLDGWQRVDDVTHLSRVLERSDPLHRNCRSPLRGTRTGTRI